MKKITFTLSIIMILLAISSCQTGDVVETAKTAEETVNYDKKYINGYEILGDIINFYFHPEITKQTNVKTVDIKGTFTKWSKGTPISLKYNTENMIWEAQRKIADINIPGNSGSPEFKFVLNGSSWQQPNKLQLITHKFSDSNGGNNNRIVFSDDSTDDLISIYNGALRNITEYTNDEDLSNFRELTNGNIKEKRLFRSYHPFIKSKSHSREQDRIDKVSELIINNKIKSVINLGDTTADINTKGTDYYKAIFNTNNVLMLPNATYNVFYYESGTEDFKKVIKLMGEFVLNHEAPFLIHCRLGTDRTGVTSAIFLALCGATWKEIATDYEKSNNLGLKDEYRNQRLLKYSLKQMLKLNEIKDDDILETAMTNYFINTGLSTADVSNIKDKLAK